MAHFIKICKECGKVISHCRCPSQHKTKTYEVCDECKSKDDKNGYK